MIEVFDSGVGGLSVWRELYKVMPQEEYLYVSDSGYCPYGPKSREEVIERAVAITGFLISNGAEIIVVACNTATAAAINWLRSHYTIPFVGMEPAVKPAALNTRTGAIGVLATKGTFKGELYLRTLHKFASNAKVLEQVGEGLVELVESGETDTPQARELIGKYIKPMLEQNADHIVLGCTHYPFLENVIREFAGVCGDCESCSCNCKEGRGGTAGKKNGCRKTFCGGKGAEQVCYYRKQSAVAGKDGFWDCTCGCRFFCF